MTRPCSICTNSRRAEIDRALVKGAPIRALEKEFGVSRAAISRHRLNCTGLPAVGTKQARDARREISKGTVALASLPSREEMGAHYATLGERIDGIVRAAEKAGSLAVAVQGLNSLRQNLDSISKLAGHTGGAPQVNVGVQVNISAGEIAAELAKMLKGSDAKVIEEALSDKG